MTTPFIVFKENGILVSMISISIDCPFWGAFEAHLSISYLAINEHLAQHMYMHSNVKKNKRILSCDHSTTFTYLSKGIFGSVVIGGAWSLCLHVSLCVCVLMWKNTEGGISFYNGWINRIYQLYWKRGITEWNQKLGGRFGQ